MALLASLGRLPRGPGAGAALHCPCHTGVPGLVLRGIGRVDRNVRELAEMLYKFQEPFVVDHGKFARAFGGDVTPLEEAIARTVAWYRSAPAAGPTP
jgi:hypothetical protein